MKDISQLLLPEDVKYSDDHEWARQVGETVTAGISDYAQDRLGDIVYVELPEVGMSLNRGDQFGTVESVKAVSELYMPIGGRIEAVNESLMDEAEKVNNDPYDSGWMIKIKPADTTELIQLMTRDAYLAMLKG